MKMKRFLASNVHDPDAVRQMGAARHHQQVDYVLTAPTKRQALELLTARGVAAYRAGRIIDLARVNATYTVGVLFAESGLIPEDAPSVLAYERAVNGQGVFALATDGQLVQVATFVNTRDGLTLDTQP